MQLKKTKPLLFVLLVSTFFLPFLRVSSLQNDSYKISSGGMVDYLPPPSLELRSFEVYTRKYISGQGYVECDQQDYYNMRDWGMTACRANCFWGASIEPSQNSPGVYSTAYIDHLEKHIKMADKAGLKWVISIRVSYDDAETFTDANWGWGWGTAAYVCTPSGLDRYCKMLEWWVKTWEAKNLPNILGYNPWLFPFHHTGPTSAQRTFYYSQVLPRIAEVVRKNSDKLVFLQPIHMSRVNLQYILDSTIEENRGRAYYGFQFYTYKGMVYGGVPTQWDYDEQYQRDFLKAAIDFKIKHNVSVYISEFGVNSERQDQLDCLDLKLRLLKEYGIPYGGYWSYSWYEGEWGFSILHNNKTPKWKLVNVIKKWNTQ